MEIRCDFGKGMAEPARNRVTNGEVEEFLKTIRKADYSVI